MFAYQNICGLETIADEFDLFLIDQFGVLHDGTRPYEGAIECLIKLRSLGKSVVLLSNSGRRSTANADRLISLGFPVEAFDHVVTSGEVAWQGIVTKTFGEPFVAGRKIFLLGHDDYNHGFEQIGLKIVLDPVAADFIMIAASSAPEISFDEYRRILSLPAAAHIPALCCNPDRLMLTPDGLRIVGAGRCDLHATSVLPPNSDIARCGWHVSTVPAKDITTKSPAHRGA